MTGGGRRANRRIEGRGRHAGGRSCRRGCGEGGLGGGTGRWVEEGGFRRILLLLRNHCGVDFSLYQPSTMQRRVARRMVLSKCETLEALRAFLAGQRSGTGRALRGHADQRYELFPRTRKHSKHSRARCFQRCSSPGGGGRRCGYGSRAVRPARRPIPSPWPTGVFRATARVRRSSRFSPPTSTNALLDKARHGLLPQGPGGWGLARAAAALLRRGGRRLPGQQGPAGPVHFRAAGILSDPPFSRLDLISCRNLLIYIETGSQQRILPAFHYALRPDGFLFLGASESITASADLFEPLDKRMRLFRRRPG